MLPRVPSFPFWKPQLKSFTQQVTGLPIFIYMWQILLPLHCAYFPKSSDLQKARKEVTRRGFKSNHIPVPFHKNHVHSLVYTSEVLTKLSLSFKSNSSFPGA